MANEETQLAKDQKSDAGSDPVVLVSAFVARDSVDDKSSTHRYGLGEVFKPLSGVHDVAALVASGVLGKADGKSVLRPATALSLAQKAAERHQEDSPVLDLNAQPFEQAVPVDSQTA